MSALLIFKNIRGLAVKRLANALKGGKAYRPRLARFKYRKICLSNTDLLGKLARGNFSFCHHNIEIYYNRHIRHLYSKLVFRLNLYCGAENILYNP